VRLLLVIPQQGNLQLLLPFFLSSSQGIYFFLLTPTFRKSIERIYFLLDNPKIKSQARLTTLPKNDNKKQPVPTSNRNALTPSCPENPAPAPHRPSPSSKPTVNPVSTFAGRLRLLPLALSSTYHLTIRERTAQPNQ
jgi:hypothetical protein